MTRRTPAGFRLVRPAILGLLVLSGLVPGCEKEPVFPPVYQHPRSFRMGFSPVPPRADPIIAFASINAWIERSDAATLTFEPPWDSLLSGVSPDSLVVRDLLPLANYFRLRNLKLWAYLDPENGLNRASDSDALVRLGRSLTEPAIQDYFRRYAVALDRILRPDHLGLALETNLIRAAASPALYAAVRQAVNAAADDVRARDPFVLLSVSVQVDVAWGRTSGGVYQGVATDLADFPFIQELGLSSYPYLAGFTNPEDIPLDYYSRLAAETGLPVMVTEGGWTSASLGNITSSPETQRRYIVRQSQLLDAAQAIAVFQLTFTDLDLVANPPPPGSILPLFAHLGLVDTILTPKPALSAWDSVFARLRGQ